MYIFELTIIKCIIYFAEVVTAINKTNLQKNILGRYSTK